MSVQYVIVFDKPIRLGSFVAECVGPFASIGEALDWLQGEFAIELPSNQILSILQPRGDK